MGKSAAPTPPNAQQVAQAQTTSNKETAVAQAGLNATNQVTPNGNLTYSQVGTWPDGTPRFQATTSLTPAGQQIFDTSQQTSQNLANVAKDQSARLGGLLAAPFSLDNDATEARLNELASKRLDPMLDRRRESADATLAAKGFKVGSTGYDRGMEQVNQAENDARNQLLLTGRNQAVQEAMMERNQPLNEILALAGQGQIAQPNFTSTPQTGVAGTDIAGLTTNQYNQQFQQYQQQQAANQNLLGGLFGLGANAALAFSDRRLKKDIKPVGKTGDGQTIYQYRYKIGGPLQMGLMAQEVEKVKPEAVVTHSSGFKMVDYEKAVA